MTDLIERIRSAESVRLTDNERRVLSAWIGSDEESNVLSFAAVAHRTDTHQGSVRRFVRALARKGILQFCRMCWDDEGPRGAGYMPTAAGQHAILALEAQKP